MYVVALPSGEATGTYGAVPLRRSRVYPVAPLAAVHVTVMLWGELGVACTPVGAVGGVGAAVPGPQPPSRPMPARAVRTALIRWAVRYVVMEFPCGRGRWDGQQCGPGLMVWRRGGGPDWATVKTPCGWRVGR
ncbi:hypothetical protein GCM10017781_08300 [Deinococcus metalli]|uniref:Uncharacterized protein n=1 Tax=Deinococcus metalli TaxID=1141878 RepID=A0ABQ3JJ99_9DEIO|nr:hypothetical protein GCM10017781_08300 [Deinococcus metalli]